jgi:hypothetical protein
VENPVGDPRLVLVGDPGAEGDQSGEEGDQREEGKGSLRASKPPETAHYPGVDTIGINTFWSVVAATVRGHNTYRGRDRTDETV